MPGRSLSPEWGVPALLLSVQRVLRGIDQSSSHPLRIAVALSGGADSAMLALHTALATRSLPRVELHCLHIHHGLQATADAWQDRVHELAAALGVPCHSLRVQVNRQSGKGVEGAARDARYAGLAQLARSLDISHVLLAHHRDDQAETVLMRLLRGSGPTGLSAMKPETIRDGLIYLRPWLDVDRQVILEAAAHYEAIMGWAAVHDPTNTDQAYTRGVVRRRLVPVLNERWPAWRSVLARHARQAAETAELLNEVAQQDFTGLDPCPDGRSFSLEAWRKLGPQRQVLVLRYWLALNGLRAPTEARMRELCRQLRGLHALGHDRSMQMRHDASLISCVRGRVGVSLQNDIPESR